MRGRTLTLISAIILLAPTVLAFRRGGDFSASQHPVASLVAAAVAWLLVVALALVARTPLPRLSAGRLALAGMALLAAWTGASISWAPVAGAATRDFQLALFYLAALVVAAAALRGGTARRRIDPVLAMGTLVVIGYGLVVRLLPDLISSLRTSRADNRLDQPLTYWNAEGALAGMGLVLCARIAGDAARSARARALAAAGSVPLAVGLYLTYSRGALAMVGAALLVLFVLAPTRPQAGAIAVVLLGGTAAVFTATRFTTVASLVGSKQAITRDGAVFLAVLLVIALITGLAAAAFVRWEHRSPRRVRRLTIPRWAPLGTAGIIAVVVGLVVYAGLQERGTGKRQQTVASAARLTRVDSNRYEYWAVAVRAFADAPIRGLGAGGFAVAWLRERPTPETPRRAHSLELEIAANLGIVGLVALSLLLAGAIAAARRAHRHSPELVAGWCAAATVWVLHSTIDWDWEMPAVSLLAFILAGALVGVADEPFSDVPEPARRGARLRVPRALGRTRAKAMP